MSKLKFLKLPHKQNIKHILIELNNFQTLISEEDNYVLVNIWDNEEFLSIEKEVDLYEFAFDEEFKNFVITKIINGILQNKILTLPLILFFPMSFLLDNANGIKRTKDDYKTLKEIYKELTKIGITKKLTLKEKIIIKLLV